MRAEPKVFTITQFMEATGLSRSTVYRMIDDGRLEAHRFGGQRWLIPITELSRLEKQK